MFSDTKKCKKTRFGGAAGEKIGVFGIFFTKSFMYRYIDRFGNFGKFSPKNRYIDRSIYRCTPVSIEFIFKQFLPKLGRMNLSSSDSKIKETFTNDHWPTAWDWAILSMIKTNLSAWRWSGCWLESMNQIFWIIHHGSATGLQNR